MADYTIKHNCTAAVVSGEGDETVAPPSAWTATGVTLVIRKSGKTSGAVTVAGSINAGGGTPFPEAEVNTTLASLAAGVYDCEWRYTSAGAETERKPTGTHKSLQIVEALS
jgi:hypothetical protein